MSTYLYANIYVFRLVSCTYDNDNIHVSSRSAPELPHHDERGGDKDNESEHTARSEFYTRKKDMEWGRDQKVETEKEREREQARGKWHAHQREEEKLSRQEQRAKELQESEKEIQRDAQRERWGGRRKERLHVGLL